MMLATVSPSPLSIRARLRFHRRSATASAAAIARITARTAARPVASNSPCRPSGGRARVSIHTYSPDPPRTGQAAAITASCAPSTTFAVAARVAAAARSVRRISGVSASGTSCLTPLPW